MKSTEDSKQQVSEVCFLRNNFLAVRNNVLKEYWYLSSLVFYNRWFQAHCRFHELLGEFSVLQQLELYNVIHSEVKKPFVYFYMKYNKGNFNNLFIKT
jgi:hypothetical protein